MLKYWNKEGDWLEVDIFLLGGNNINENNFVMLFFLLMFLVEKNTRVPMEMEHICISLIAYKVVVGKFFALVFFHFLFLFKMHRRRNKKWKKTKLAMLFVSFKFVFAVFPQKSQVMNSELTQRAKNWSYFSRRK